MIINEALTTLYKQFTKREPVYDEELSKVKLYKVRPMMARAALFNGENIEDIKREFDLENFSALPGQMVVQDADGSLHIMSESAFRARYEPTVMI